MSTCKITVLRKMFNEDYAREYCLNPETTVCTAFQEGQTFLLTNQDKPAGFSVCRIACTWLDMMT